MTTAPKKIGLVTWHYYTNYGSMLQTYALLKTIRSLGYQCEVLNYHNPKFGKVSTFKSLIKSLVSLLPSNMVRQKLPNLYFPRDRFRKFFHETPIVYKKEELTELCDKYDAVVCGSDQIWAPNIFNPVYFLNFVPNNKLKISYAASIGLNEIPKHLIEDYRFLIERINCISVREAKGKEIIKNISDRDVSVVLDPTLLVDEREWSKISTSPQVKSPYIFCYFLNENHEYQISVKKLAKANSLKLIGWSARKEDNQYMELIDDQRIGPQEFLGLIKNSEAVLTDSYHGTIFSLLFHRPFLTFERFKRSDILCQNSRINQLKEYFNLQKQIIECGAISDLNIQLVNWVDFENRLQSLRDKSILFLKNALEEC